MNFFVRDKIIDPSILSTDSTLIKAQGYVWHKSSMKKKVLPRSGIDTDARWGFSHTKGWIFGYKLHLISNTGSIIVPLAADFTTANIPDNQMYSILITASLPVTMIKRILYMSANPGYDDHELYDSSSSMGFQLVCPVKRYRNTPSDRIKLIEFYKSDIGQTIYSLRSISIEPLIEHIKSVFRVVSITCERICQGIFSKDHYHYCSIRYLSIITVKLEKIIQEQSNTC